MNENQNHLDALSDIRKMMDRSTRVVSLSGLSGVFVGLFALAGALMAHLYFNSAEGYYYRNALSPIDEVRKNFYTFFFIDAGLVLIFSVLVSSWLSIRKAKKIGAKFWDNAVKRLFINIMIPLAAGGLLCLIMVYHHLVFMVAPLTLIFYGLALINGSKYTLDEIRQLGIAQIIIGLIAALIPGYGLYFWALGFGVLHIIYGIFMYLKYDK